MRASVWRNTIIVAFLYLVVIVVAHRLLVQRLGMHGAIALALAFGLAQIGAIVIMVATLFVRKQRNALRLARSRLLIPQINEALATHAIGVDQRPRLEELRRQSAGDVREALFGMIASMRGEARERVAALARELGFFDVGELSSTDALRKLIRLGHSTHFDQIAIWVATQNLLVRAIAVEELEAYAALIGEPQIARALRSSDVKVVMTMLDMLRGWRRALHVDDFSALLTHSDARVRLRALLALPYAAADAPAESLAPAIVALIADENSSVRAAAATAAGRLGLTDTIGLLEARLADGDRDVAIAAAFALSSLGQGGLALLDRTVLSADRAAASVAFEALEKSAIGLAEFG